MGAFGVNPIGIVGNFLIENGVITMKDRDMAFGMIQEYEERLQSMGIT